MSDRTCSVTTCERQPRTAGYCGAHYKRLREHGDVHADVPVKVYPEPAKICSRPGCAKAVKSRGLCWRHHRLSRLADGSLPPLSTIGTAERFWMKVDRRGPSECWLWLAATNIGGYGRFYPTREHGYYAHRFSYELRYGPIPDELVIDHLCRTPGCVNPAHLEAVAHRTNTLRGISPAAKNAVKIRCINGRELVRTYHRRERSVESRCCEFCTRPCRANATRGS